MLQDGPSFSVFKDMGAKEQSAVFHPASGEWTQAGFVYCAVPSDGWAEEILMGPYDATFTVGALSVLSRSEDAGLPLEESQLGRKVLTNFLDKGAEKTANILPVCLVRNSMDAVGEGIAA